MQHFTGMPHFLQCRHRKKQPLLLRPKQGMHQAPRDVIAILRLMQACLHRLSAPSTKHQTKHSARPIEPPVSPLVSHDLSHPQPSSGIRVRISPTCVSISNWPRRLQVPKMLRLRRIQGRGVGLHGVFGWRIRDICREPGGGGRADTDAAKKCRVSARTGLSVFRCPALLFTHLLPLRIDNLSNQC